jgi:DNA-binding response OmpR family regulator
LPWRDEEAAPGQPVMALPTTVPQHKPQVLVLAAEEAEAQQLITAMRAYDIDVAATDDLRNAIMLASQQPPDLILIDVPLPDYNLVETVHQLRTVIPIVRTPILALTAIQVPGHQTIWRQAGIATYRPKPISFRNLGALIYAYANQPVRQ